MREFTTQWFPIKSRHIRKHMKDLAHRHGHIIMCVGRRIIIKVSAYMGPKTESKSGINNIIQQSKLHDPLNI